MGRGVNGWIEVTASAMDPAWLVFDRGTPGTVAHELGGAWWCRRCFTSPATGKSMCARTSPTTPVDGCRASLVPPTPRR